MKGAIHVHTKESYDSISSPRKIEKFCEQHKIDIVAITDHETLKGYEKMQEYLKNRKSSLKIIPGIEIKTDIGDIIGLFIKREIKESHHKRVIKEIKKQGGLVILPHPYHQHNEKKVEAMKGIDFIEIWNGRTSVYEDKKARDLCKKIKAKPIGGSDAHLVKELNNCTLEFENIEKFKEGKLKIIKNKKSRKKDIAFTQIIKGIKTHNIKLISVSILSYFYNLARKK